MCRRAGLFGCSLSSKRRRADAVVGVAQPAARIGGRLPLLQDCHSLFRNASMHRARTATIAPPRAWALIAAILIVRGASGLGRAVAEESSAYVVEVSDVTAKVGDHAVMLVTLRIRDGYRILEPYNNRVIALSSFDDGVDFERKMVPAELQEGALVFEVGLQATKPGKHPINGIFRVGYIHEPDDLSMVSVPLIANVTGTE